MNLDDDIKKHIFESCIDESTKIIQYIEEKEKKQFFYNAVIFICSIIASVTGVISVIIAIR